MLLEVQPVGSHVNGPQLAMGQGAVLGGRLVWIPMGLCQPRAC